MSETLAMTEIQKADQEKIEKLQTALNNLKDKKSKIIFCVPENHQPSVSVYEIYLHATVVKNMGFEVIILTEKPEYIIPYWIEENLIDFKHIPMSDPKLSVSIDDIMVIPDVYSNIMEQTKNLPCLRVGFLQSIDYMMNSLIPGVDWKSFGVNDIITTSKMLKDILNIYYHNKFNVKTYNIGIPNYFSKTNEPQKPVISIIGRNPNEISKLVKLFYAKFPQYGWVTFDPMLTKSKPPQTMRRIDFAKRLQGNFAAVWIDRISSFGTFPLECMKSGVIPICLKPDILPEYLIERDENDIAFKFNHDAGVWTDNFYDIPIIIGDLIIKFLDDNIPTEMYDNMDKIVIKYSQEDSKKQIEEIYTNLINERIKLLESAFTKPDNSK